MKNQNSKFKHVLQEYDVESVEIYNYDLSAKLKDKIKREKLNNIAKDKESKMPKKSKIDMLYEIVLEMKTDFNEFKTEIKNDLNNFKIEVREEFSKVNSRLDKLEDDVHILKQDVNSLKSEAIKHGWNIN